MPEQYIRFGITDGKGLRAATWKLWTPNNKSDIYLACRELGGELKASLHESGNWHIAYNRSTFDNLVKGYVNTEHDRYIKKWNTPKPIAPGIILAFRIVTPYSAVTSNIKQSYKDIVWIPNPTALYATEIDIFIISPITAVTGWPGKNNMNTKLIGSYKLANKVSVWLVYHVVDMPDLNPATKGTARFYKGRSYNDLKSNHLRALVIGKEPDGSRVLYDTAVVKKK